MEGGEGEWNMFVDWEGLSEDGKWIGGREHVYLMGRIE